MWSALFMFRNLARVLRHAYHEQDFAPVFGAACALVVAGTVGFALGNDWHVVDAFYFAVSTLTTTSVADPDLVLDQRWMKLFAVFFQLIGIGLLVELLRRLGGSWVAVKAAERDARGR